MRIVMFTNTYLPHVGGVARSVDRFTRDFRSRGHDVLVVAPAYDDQPADEEHVLRIPAIQHFNGSDFAMAIPVGFDLSARLDEFEPDLIHAHHPYLLGNSALRAAAARNLPMVFTHHTMYEHYTHYVPLEGETLKRYVIALATGFANFCECVIAPSESTAEILRDRGVTSPVEVVPTGVRPDEFRHGDGEAFRREWDIPQQARLIGHVGRLAPEKSPELLVLGAAEAMRNDPSAWLVVVGPGESREAMEGLLRESGLDDRSVFTGPLTGRELVDAYHATDVFGFTSRTETQGMVLVETMAAGVPVVALDAPGAREVVADGANGRLVAEADPASFAAALTDILSADAHRREKLAAAAFTTADQFSVRSCADRTLEVYRWVLSRQVRPKPAEGDQEWASLLRSIRREWNIWSNRLSSLTDSLTSGQTSTGHPDRPPGRR